MAMSSIPRTILIAVLVLQSFLGAGISACLAASSKKCGTFKVTCTRCCVTPEEAAKGKTCPMAEQGADCRCSPNRSTNSPNLPGSKSIQPLLEAMATDPWPGLIAVVPIRFSVAPNAVDRFSARQLSFQSLLCVWLT
jgi:hypothetical protein